MLEQQLLNALTLGSVYALFALGFTLVFGVLAVINLSHGAVFMVGSYAALALVTRLEAPLWAAMLGAMLVSGTLGLLVDVLILRPLRARNAPHLIPMIATIGVGIMLTSTAQGLFGAELLRFPDGTLPAGEFVVGDVHVRALEIAIVAIAFALMAVLFAVLKRTQLGRALRAIAESPKAAWLLGINVERLFHVTSFAAAALGGIAGVLIGLNFNAITPQMGQPILHKGIAAIILGGMGDIRGALFGGLFLGFAEVISKAYLSSQMGDAVAFGLLFLILLVRPSGLFGRKLERKA
ncbi:branched-chain amino acid ABC transporter permease [Azoarcus sp. DN11]|uniref:branched-chain amino acid ABC transporter permease n=1 Tax=Azoarcus sp. DN11 TaxID=356837 RepID=UPI000EAE4C43|nr:branched-chain amino acid ABC transporter permease [Azoarcus sp. DN11]AYH41927.1 branched-chain amino acid ABC transporter permease [Azoarcus sp. DN11]